MVNIVISFDDGRRDNYRIAKEVLEKKSIPATFNITSGYICKSINDSDMPGPHEPMTVSEVQDLAASDIFEIAGHGIKHNNELNNLIGGVEELRGICKNKSIIGIASPNSKFDVLNIEHARRIFERYDIKYLRVGNDYKRMSYFKRQIRRLNRILNIEYLYYWTNMDSVIKEPEFLVHGVPIIRDNSLNELVKFVNTLINKHDGQSCILIFHSILSESEPYYRDLFTWDYNKFTQFCEYLDFLRNSNKIRIIKTCDLFEL